MPAAERVANAAWEECSQAWAEWIVEMVENRDRFEYKGKPFTVSHALIDEADYDELLRLSGGE